MADASIASIRGVKEKDRNPPVWVRVVPHLKIDVKAIMMILTCYEKPPDVPIAEIKPRALYIIGNALGVGFSLSGWIQEEAINFAEF